MSGSSGTTGLPIPKAIMPVGGKDPTGLLKPLKVEADGSLDISGSIVASNPSVGPNGSPAPVQSTEIGFIAGGGNLQGVSSSNPLPVAVTSGPNPQNVNLTQVGGSNITEGQKTMATSLPVVIASDQSAVPVSAASLPLPTGASTAALQSNVQSAPGTPQTVAITVQGNASSVAIPVSAASLPLPSGAATSANQTNGSQKTQVVDGSGTVQGPAQTIAGTNYMPVVLAASATPGSAAVARSIQVAGSDGTNARTLSTDTSGNLNVNVANGRADISPSTQNITVVDSGSTTTAQANGQNAITGSPTAGSTASFSVSSETSIDIQVTGVWTGTLVHELSVDGGTTWFSRGVKQTGSSYISSNFIQNFEASGNITGATNVRIRATAAMTGTATVKIVLSNNPYVSIITNPLTLRDSVTQSISNTIKAASTAAVATDTAIVVGLSPNSNSIASTGPVSPGTAASFSDLAGMVYHSSVQAPTNGQQLSLQSDAFGNLLSVLPDMLLTGASAQTATVNNILTNPSGSAATNVSNYRSASVQIVSTGTGGTYIFEGSNDNVNFQTLTIFNVTTIAGNLTNAAITATASQLIYTFPVSTQYVRVRIASTITGGSIQAFARFSQAAWTPAVFQIAQSTPANLNTTTTLSGSAASIGLVYLQNPTLVNDIASSTISATTTTAAITPSGGSSYQINIDVTGVNGSGTIRLDVQESSDTGTNWYTVYSFPLIAINGTWNSPILTATGNRIRYVQTITGTSVTRSINRLQSNTSAQAVYRNLLDASINPTSTNSVTPTVFVENTNTYTAIVNQGSGGSAVQFAMDGSDDGNNWVLGLTSVYGVTGGATPVVMTYSDVAFRYVRVRVVTGVAATTISYVSIVGSVGSGDGVSRGVITNRSGSSSTSSAQLAPANSLRNYIFIQNIDSSITQYINFTAAADVSTNSIALLPFASYSMEGNFVSTEAINIIAASGTPKYIAKEG